LTIPLIKIPRLFLVERMLCIYHGYDGEKINVIGNIKITILLSIDKELS
jgi:hypothetical protein